jgi:hypothetical protein
MANARRRRRRDELYIEIARTFFPNLTGLPVARAITMEIDRTSWTPLPPHLCPECNTAWRLVPWRRCLSELMGAADPSSS